MKRINNEAHMVHSEIPAPTGHMWYFCLSVADTAAGLHTLRTRGGGGMLGQHDPR